KRVSPATRDDRHGDDRCVQRKATGGSEECGVAKGVDPPVRAEQPVATAIFGGRDGNDRSVQGNSTQVSLESCGTESGHLPRPVDNVVTPATVYVDRRDSGGRSERCASRGCATRGGADGAGLHRRLRP